MRKPRRLPATAASATATKFRVAVLPRRSTDPAIRRELSAAPFPTPVQGAVCLDIAGASAAAVMALTLKARDGLTDNVYYEELTAILAALTASYNGQRSLADLIGSLENQLKTARLAQETETVNGREILKSAARACESLNSTDEALASAGWTLRKSRTPSQILPPPSRLRLRNTPFMGEVTALWGRVHNNRFYEYQMDVPLDNAATPDWSTVPILNTTVAQVTFPKFPVGRLMHVRVRTVSAKGPGPWSDTVTGVVL